MWPYFSRDHDRWLNRQLLTRQLSRRLRPGRNTIALTTLPITADLVGKLPVAKWVYYCVDDFSQWPGLDGKTLERMERELVGRVDTIVAASAVLQERMATLGRGDAHLLTHGVDLAHWQVDIANSSPDILWPEVPRPLIVFWGLIDRRLDAEWLAALSAALPEGTILLVGPTQNPDPNLEELPHVALRPALPFADLPKLAQAASALIMPYAELPVTRAMQPLKLLEYLATGKPVIVRDLPAVAQWRMALDACGTSDEFVAKVMERKEAPLVESQYTARECLEAESWQTKAAQLEAWLRPGEQPHCIATATLASPA
jgi:glycosyltransferase involved in cell wall biosynthesis